MANAVARGRRELLAWLDERGLEQREDVLGVLDRVGPQAQVATVSAPSSSEIATSIE
jgi:hypothetical protein